MRVSLNEILHTIPLYQLTFITPFPKEEIFYENVITSISEEWLDRPTLLVIEKPEDWQKLNQKEVASHIIQDPYLYAIVIYYKTKNPLQTDILSFFMQCQIPIMQIEDHALIANFLQKTRSSSYYSNLSVELDGFYKRGFMDIASNLSMAFRTPLLFLDENQQLLWQTGTDQDIRKCLQWIRAVQSKSHSQFSTEEENESEIPSSLKQSFEHYTMNIAGQIQLSLIASPDLVDWQKKIIDKFIGFTAVLFQTEEVVREQNDKFKEFFIYELIYRKFESKKALIKQGKTWGWNLEKSHHLLVVDVEPPEQLMNNVDVLDEVVFHLETRKSKLHYPLIIFPFQDHIVVLIEDEKNRTSNERKDVAIKIASWMEGEITAAFPMCQLNIGIGKWYFDTIDLNKSYQEAKIALQFGKIWFENKRIYHMNDLGVLHLLTNIHRDLLHGFCEEYLPRLIESDQEQGTEYLKTLKMYFQYHGIVNDVSEALFIHPNTLRKRLKKIEEMVGFSLQNLEQLLTLMVAVKIYYSFSL